jgi:adenylate cyclase
VAEDKITRKLTTILAADVEGYTRLMRADEEATLKTLGEYRDVIDGLIARHDGRVFSTGGDSVLAEFGSVVEAVRCAISCQEEISSRNAELADDRKLIFRMGVNVGDVMVRDGDLFGDGVNVAARLEGLAEAGGVCISGSVFEQIKHKLSLGFEDMGQQEVKNIAEPVSAYRLVPGQVSVAATAAAKSSRMRHWRIPAMAAAVVLIIAAGGLAIWRPWEPGMELASGQKTTLPLPDKPSIAVLPFTNLSGDPKQDYLSDGITESLITRLARQPEMFVIARNSSFTYKDKAVKVQQVGRDLGVRYVLEGSVQKAGERLRITVQLIEAATGEHLWADGYDRELQDLFAVQDEITRKVTIELAVKLTVGEVARSDVQATDNVEAYDHWLRGVEAYRLFEKETNVQAGDLFDIAIELDPQYARAIAYLGWVRLNESRFWWVEDRDRSFEQAEELARRAIAIDEDSSVGHNLLSRIYSLQRQYEQAIAEGERTVAIEPSSASAYASLAWTMALAGRPKDGLVLIRKALRLSPYPPVWYLNVDGGINYLTGRYEESIASGRKLLERTQEGLQARDAWKRLIASYVELGREAEARAEAEIYLEHDPFFSVKEHAEWLGEFVYKDRSWQDRYIEALRKAGLPE